MRPTPLKRLLLLSLLPLFLGLFWLLKRPKAPEFQDKKCQAMYSNFYEKDLIDLRVIFGYKDGRPARFVGDRYERSYFIQKIIGLGLERSESDEDLFTHRVVGPDGKYKLILLRVVGSSVGPDDEENRGNPFQKWQSAYAERVFLEGLHTANGIFYNGHSRAGGGPDFEPPRCRAGSQVDYGWYRKHQPGFRRMISALKGADPGPKLIGLFSCASNRLFSQEIHKVNPKAGLIATNQLLYYADSLDNLVETLKALIEMKCPPDFHLEGTRILGLFDPDGA